MQYEIEVTKDDLKFINATAVKSYGYGVENVRCRFIENHLLFEATDTHMLLRKRFPVKDAHEYDKDSVYEMHISPEFFKRLIYLCKQKEIINIEVDFEAKEIIGTTLMCTIVSQHVSELREYPDTEKVYPEDDGVHEMIFKKEILEKFLNSLPNNEPYLKFSFVDGDNPWMRPIVVRTGENSSEWSEERNLIMGVRPQRHQW